MTGALLWLLAGLVGLVPGGLLLWAFVLFRRVAQKERGRRLTEIALGNTGEVLDLTKMRAQRKDGGR